MKIHFKKTIFLGLTILGSSFVIAAPPQAPISDCEFLAKRATQIVDANLRENGRMIGSEVNQLQEDFPGILRNRLQFYLASASLNWTASGGDVEKVYFKTLDNCNRFH